MELVELHLDLGAPPPDPDRGRCGERIGAQIELRAHLRDGGAGAVYLGVHERDGTTTPVAVKLLRVPEREAERAALKETWLREQGLLREFSSSGAVAPLVEAGEHTGPDGARYLYLCTEYKHGFNLRRWCEAHELPVPARIALFLQACEAVSAIHAHGLVHGDLKPENIQVHAPDGVARVWLLDLGLTAVQGHLWRGRGELVGTPGYMSPEQVSEESGAIGETSDVYALGAILFELLEGHPWLDARDLATPEALLERMRRAPLPRLTSVEARRAELEAVLCRALSLEASERYAAVSALREALRRWLAAELGATGTSEWLPAHSLRDEARATPLYGAPRGRSQAFVGRESELRELGALLGARTHVSVAASIEGLAGIGKTELALQLVHRLAQEGRFPGGIFWLAAEQPDLRPIWSGEMATRWGIPPGPPAERTAMLLRELGRLRVPLLVVLDNVTSWSDGAIPGPLPEGAHVRVLVTTRARSLGGAQFAHVSLGVLPPPQDRELVQRLSGRDAAPGLDVLLEHLGGHALALELAGAFLRVYPGETPASYLEQMLENQEQIEGEVSDQIRYERTVTQAFQTLWERLPESARAAWRRAACFDPDPATRELARAVDLDRRTLRALEDVNLVQSHEDGRWHMHRLTRAYGRRSGTAAELETARRAFVEGALAHSRTMEDAGGLAVYRADRTHLDAALELGGALWDEPTRALDELRLWIGRARNAIGDLEGSRALIDPAVRSLRAELAGDDLRACDPLGWAELQHRLGCALRTLGEREAGTETLEAAVEALRCALLERTRERVPLDWAGTQHNLGGVLLTLGGRESGTQRLEQAVDAFRDALLERTRERVPLGWAAIQHSLGAALWTLGAREAGTRRLEEAVDAYRDALLERTRERVPLDWAATQNNLGATLWTLGSKEASTFRLEQAVDAYRDALLERTRECVPLEWAGTQHNLALALWSLGEREPDTQRFEQAIDAFRDALLERTRERVPLDWAKTQNALGNALATLGTREAGTQRLEQAIDAYRNALLERTRERVPLEWAATQNNLGNVFRTLGEREPGTRRLEQAVDAYRDALREYVRERVPLYWALAQNNLGNALRALGERESGTGRLEEAEAACRAALEERMRERVPLDWALTQNHLGDALRLLGTRAADTERLRQAVDAYRSALGERLRERVPHDWVETQMGLAAVLRKLAECDPGGGWLEEARVVLREVQLFWQAADAPEKVRETSAALAELERSSNGDRRAVSSRSGPA